MIGNGTHVFSSMERKAMLSLPITFSSAIGIFAPVFSRPVWQHAKVLLTGAVLAPGKRTVTSILQVMGRTQRPTFRHIIVCCIALSGHLSKPVGCSSGFSWPCSSPVVSSSLDLMTLSNVDAGIRSLPKASIVIPCGPHTHILSKSVACAGLVVCCCPPSPGPSGSGPCPL